MAIRHASPIASARRSNRREALRIARALWAVRDVTDRRETLRTARARWTTSSGGKTGLSLEIGADMVRQSGYHLIQKRLG